MNLHILAIGKKKSEYDAVIAGYQKRVTAPFEVVIEVLEPLGIDNPDRCRAKESEKLLGKIKSGDFVIALDEAGKEFSTVQFAELIDKKLHESYKRVVFVIGGAYGLDADMKKQAGLIMRLSTMTFPHEMARLVIAEQLYRATNFLQGGKYHHQ